MHSIKEIIGNTYQQKLTSGQWSSFSSSIRRKRKNACESCRRTNVITQVHHIVYEPGKQPWESDEKDVVLLCESCHKQLHDELNNFRRFTFRFMTPQAFLIFNRALMVAAIEYDPLVFAHAFAEFVGNENLVNNHAKTYGLSTAKAADAEAKKREVTPAIYKWPREDKPETNPT